jgi:exodeoxyribonuclease-1
MALNFFFYDLETSGINSVQSRIMQFGGQRTSLDLKPIGEPINTLVKLPDDVLPEPDAVLVHGITPQQTLAEGITEQALSLQLITEVFTKDTIAVGFNNIRFDDEFIRHLMWRNFYDPYEWHWKAGRSRWDLLDALRMTRALRPDGLKWPFDKEGQPVNKLGTLAQANKVALDNAHDALADVMATIGLAKKFKTAQPKLFNWLLNQRNKHEVAKTISKDNPKPFVYTSGRYASEVDKTTIAVVLGPHPTDSNSVLVFDLRYSPSEISDLSVKELIKRIYVKREDREKYPPLPVKKLAMNKCPAIAPIGTLDEEAQKRIGLSPIQAQNNLKILVKSEGLAQRIYEAFKDVEALPKRADPEGQLYDGFLGDKDQELLSVIRRADADKLADLHPPFIDERLSPLLLRYKARNFPSSLSDSEHGAWEGWRIQKLTKGIDGGINLAKFTTRLDQLSSQFKGDTKKLYVLEELNLYAQSIAPDQLFDS